MYIQGEQLAGLPVNYRKALFKALPTAEERTAFWQNVFTTFRRQHVLSAAQDSTLKKAEALIPEAFGAFQSGRAAQEGAVARMSDEVKRVLGPQALRELFLTAGPDGRIDSLPTTERAALRVQAWARTNMVARAAIRIAPTVFAEGDCNCNAAHNDCYYSSHCTKGLNGCAEDGGCACDWIIFDCNTCDGVCNYQMD
jgi:hypothetical protein